LKDNSEKDKQIWRVLKIATILETTVLGMSTHSPSVLSVNIQSFLSFAVNSNAFCTADPDAVLSKIHHARAPAAKLANCAASLFRYSSEYAEK
jgi:hypothetical protein